MIDRWCSRYRDKYPGDKVIRAIGKQAESSVEFVISPPPASAADSFPRHSFAERFSRCDNLTEKIESRFHVASTRETGTRWARNGRVPATPLDPSGRRMRFPGTVVGESRIDLCQLEMGSSSIYTYESESISTTVFRSTSVECYSDAIMFQ